MNIGWEEERREFFEHRGWNLEKIDKEGKEILAALFSKEGQLQREERWVRIIESEYNTWYKFVKEEVMPGYLKKRVERE